jgi:hypothetical protein
MLKPLEEVVEHERRDAGDEDAPHRARTRARLERRVERAHEPRPRDDRVVRVLRAPGEEPVGEVVVLVDEHVELVPRAAHERHQRGQERLRVHEGAEPRVDPGELGHARAMREEQALHPAPDRLEERAQERVLSAVGGNAREVEGEDQVAVALGGRVLVDPQAPEERVEALALPDVVVVRQHAHQRRLAEAPRTEEDDVLVAGLEHGEEGRLVRVEEAPVADLSEIADAVGDLHGPPRRLRGGPRLPPGGEDREVGPLAGRRRSPARPPRQGA